MNSSKLGSWLKAVAAMCAAVGLYTFSDSQIENIQIWIVAGWAFVDAGANAMKGWTKKKE